jgi:hypothetical protein
MGLADTVSVLLQFKTDLSGLERFASTLQTRLNQVQEFNRKLAGGADALNTALQAAAGFLAMGALKEYTREAIEARQAQAKLAQALQQTGQNTAGYRSELSAQAQALRRATGLQDETIAGVQRQLVFGKAQRKDIADLTALTLDFAAAKEIDAVSAAKAVGRALLGEGDELQRYGVTVNLAQDKIAALREGLGKFAGQASQSFAALPQGMRDFAIASKEAKESAGEAVLALSNPFLSGLAEGVAKVGKRLEEMRTHGSALMDILTGISRATGDFVGKHLDKLILMGTALLALKSGGYLASQALGALAAGFMVLTGRNLVALLAGLQNMSSQIGILRALAMSGWPRILAAGLATISVALAAFAAGSLLIKAIEQAQLARIEREQRVSNEVWDQVNGLNAQIAAVRSLEEVKNAQAAADKAVADNRARIAELEKKQHTAWMFRGDIVPAESYAVSDRTAQEEEELLRRREALVFLEAKAASARNPEVTDRIVDKNRKADADALAAKQATALAAKELFELNTQLLAAQTKGNQVEVDRLQQLIEEKKLQTDLKDIAKDGVDTAGLVQSRLAAEAAGRARTRSELSAAFDLATQQQLADLANNQAETNRLALLGKEIELRKELAPLGEAAAEPLIQQRLAAEKQRLDQEAAKARLQMQQTALESSLKSIEAERQRITSNTLLDENTKREKLIANGEDYRAKVAQIIAILQLERGMADQAAQAGIDAQIVELREQQKSYGLSDIPPSKISQQRTALANRGAPQNAYQSLGEGVEGGLLESLNALPTAADAVGEAITSSIGGAVAGLQQQFNQLLGTTEYWKQKLGTVGGTIVGTITAAISQMFAQLIAGMIMSYALRKLFGTAEDKANAKRATAAATQWAPAAIAASIASYGTAALYGTVAYVAALGIGTAATAAISGIGGAGGYASGGIIPGGEQLIRVNEQGTEAVLNNRALQIFGPDFIAALNAGALDLAALPDNVARKTPEASAVRSAPALAGGDSGSEEIHIGITHFDSPTAIEQWAQSRRGRRFIANMQSGQVREYR